MFVIFATKPLNDGSKGFRFNFLGAKGLVRRRKVLNRGWSVDKLTPCMTVLHMGKTSAYFEHKKTPRKLHHFAG